MQKFILQTFTSLSIFLEGVGKTTYSWWSVKYFLNGIEERFIWLVMFFARKISWKFQVVSTNLLWGMAYWFKWLNQFSMLKTKLL